MREKTRSLIDGIGAGSSVRGMPGKKLDRKLRKDPNQQSEIELSEKIIEK